MKRLKIIPVLFLVLLLPACVTNGGYGSNQTLGTMIGGGLGGLVGSQIGRGDGRLVATGIGVLGGAVIGSEIGRGMDQQQRQQHYSYPPSYGYGGHGTIQMAPPPYYGYAGCDTLGPTSQARADCVRGIADANARRDAWETRRESIFWGR